MQNWKSLAKKTLNWLLPAYLFLLPWQARYLLAADQIHPPVYGTLSLYATDMLFVVLLVVWLSTIWDKRVEAKKRLLDQIGKRTACVAVAAFVFIAISLLWTPNREAGIEHLLRLAQAILLAKILLTAEVPARRLWVALALSGMVEGGWAVVQFFTQSIPANTWLGIASQDPRTLGVSVVEYLDLRYLRAYGTLPHPNILGAWSALTAIVSLRFYLHGYDTNSRRDAMLGFLGFAGSALALLLSFSRNAWLAAAVGCVILAIIRLCQTKGEERKFEMFALFKALAIALLFFGFFTALFGPLWTQRIDDQSRLGQKSLDDRRTLQLQATEFFKERPLFGSGVGSYINDLLVVHPSDPAYAYQPVHSVYLYLLVELGVVGTLLAAVTFVLFAWHRYALRSFDFLMLVAPFLVLASFDHELYSLPIGLALAALFLALPLAKTATE